MLKVALLGCGVVGSEVARYLAEHAGDLTARIGAPVSLAGIAVRRADLDRPGVPQHLITTDALDLTRRADIVIEAIGGLAPAAELIESAFAHGASVVSANKALIASCGSSLHAAAASAGVDLYYEAAVAGAVPLIRPLRESLSGDRINRVLGIVNGTTNFILSKMDFADYPEALKEAISLGYAEADPTADVEGHDAAAKAAILAGIAFNTTVDLASVHREGITALTAADISAARTLGYAVKFLAVCTLLESGAISVRVHPAMVPLSHPLAAVTGANNAVFVSASAGGDLMFSGPGAGGAPTASAVLGDLVTAARNKLARTTGPGTPAYTSRPAMPMSSVITRSYIRIESTIDVLPTTATTLARHGVSIATATHSQHTLSLITQPSRDGSVTSAVAELRTLPEIHAIPSVIRVEQLD